MKLYNYSTITGEYLGAQEAQLDPLESVKAGKEVWLTNPDTQTTSIPPEAGANQKAVWQGEQWSLIADYRGQVFYNRETGQPIIIDELGITPENMTANYVTAEEWAIIQTERNRLAAATAQAIIDYKNMIRRKAKALAAGSLGDKYQAILILKGIGE
jgi:hypothetical protein